jgi:hypothetical protein
VRASLLLLALLGACGGTAGEADLAEVELDLVQVPADAHCLRAVFTGVTRAVTVRLDAQPGATASWGVSGLPTGEVVITADAFPVACASSTSSVARSWFAAPVVLTVNPAGTNKVSLKMNYQTFVTTRAPKAVCQSVREVNGNHGSLLNNSSTLPLC